MIEKQHHNRDVESTAQYSDCLLYRYSLKRVWEPSGERLHFVMLNPSTATEVQNDPTVERCERRARTLGYGAFCVTNIFAWRDTDPKKMRAATDPIGPHNDEAINKACDWANETIAAWGTHGAHMQRGLYVKKLLAGLNKPIFHLGLSKDGHPKHPLYISYQHLPEPWEIYLKNDRTP